MDNPLRSETQMFRVVLVVAAAAVPVIALAAIVAPLAGAIVLCVEVAIGIALLWRAIRERGSAPEG